MKAYRTSEFYYEHKGDTAAFRAGVFASDGERVAWWPPGARVTQERLAAVVTAVQARESDEPLAVDQVSALLEFKEEGGS